MDRNKATKYLLGTSHPQCRTPYRCIRISPCDMGKRDAGRRKIRQRGAGGTENQGKLDNIKKECLIE